LGRVEDLLLIFILVLMIALTVTQILLRNLFDTGLVWADMVLRTLVFAMTLIGTMAAARNDRHVRIDVVHHFLPESRQRLVGAVTKLFAAGICLLAAWYCLQFAWFEYQSATMILPGVPSWMITMIIPCCLTVTGVRFGLQAVMAVWVKRTP